MSTDMDRYLAAKQRVEQEVAYPASFRELINRAAELFGDKEGINFFERNESCTFSELRDRVYALADGLNQQGVVKGSHVAIMISNRIEFPLTWLSLAVLGAVMIPVNVRYTSNELDYILNDGDAEFFVLEQCFVELLEGMDKRPSKLVDKHIIVVDQSVPEEQANSYTSWNAVQSAGSQVFEPSRRCTEY